LGGSIVVPLMDIPNVGRFCVLKDPTGGTIAMITLGEKPPA
jgi:predicted enzyme related to lactoylglutathione lyase